MSDFGENLKQLDNRTTPTLSDLIYVVGNNTDWNLSLQQLKTLFDIGEIEAWKTVTLQPNTDSFINLVDSTLYGAVQLKYIAKRGTRTLRTGKVTLMVDTGGQNGISAADKIEIDPADGDYQGLELDYGYLSSGQIQLKATTDNSDANTTTFNYKIISKRPLIVS